ncbi:hypothetical protein AXG93_838s1020 [Marchantia polymorpha subsp. ruderalis]|uniref:Uncharacterized protein n=1 Tax=Marchantia polymorpha subsp. ruderalis TaxID=1480154 RepID=A0A176WUM6_MARPO|nr:hypothetical protein AXG93_838s1020 [Marchantia polymorpha subsp. ruderalis]
MSIIHDGVGTSGVASGCIIKGISGAGTGCDPLSIASGSMSGDVSGVPSFSLIPEFFKRLRKNYKGVKTKKLRSLQEFERKTDESLWEAYTRHPRDRCFELHPELTSSVRDRGGDASRSRGGQDGRGAGAVGRTAGIATSATESDMDALIEQLKQRLVAMAGPGASTSTPYEGENFSYLASAAQVEASVVVTKGGARALEPRGTTLELDSQRDADGYLSDEIFTIFGYGVDRIWG